MPLNKSRGNMYPWTTHTWNPVAGLCIHACAYCYMKRFKLRPIRLKEDELKTDLGTGRTIFVCSGCDLFARNIPRGWIKAVLERCREFKNTYLFQSKDPWRFHSFLENFPAGSIYGTTLESDIYYQDLSKASDPLERAAAMTGLRRGRRMVSIEPVLRFDLDRFVFWLKQIGPEFVSVGADSQGHKLPEPGTRELKRLIGALQEFTRVKLKSNLSRLLGEKIKDRDEMT